MSAIISKDPDGKTLLRCYNPASGEPLGEITGHTFDDVERSLQSLRQAAASYNYSPLKERVRLIRQFRKSVVTEMDHILEIISKETGKKHNEALIEFFGAMEIIHGLEKITPQVLRRQYRSSGVLIHKRGFVEYRPHGLAAIITPWNYPFALGIVPVVEALLAGNTAILKPSEQTSLSALLLKEIFDAATQRPELFEVVLGLGDVGEYLMNSQWTDLVCFTGSTAVGRRIAETCGRILKPCILELGGKDAMIVLSDADLPRAAKAAVWGGFTNAGQTCIAVERVYVTESVYEEFLNLAREETRQITVGNDPDNDMGSLTTDSQREKVENQLKNAADQGAKIEVFGDVWELADQYISPTIVTGLSDEMDLMKEETFGPVLAVIKVSSPEEAIQKANESRYGLCNYLFTKDKKRARRYASRLNSGTVIINDVLTHYAMASLPVGGFGDSGIGKEHGREGLLSFSRSTAIVENRLTLASELWWYGWFRKTNKLMRKFVRIWYG